MKKSLLVLIACFFAFPAFAQSFGTFSGHTINTDYFDNGFGKEDYDYHNDGVVGNYERLTADEYDGLIEELKRIREIFSRCDTDNYILKWSDSGWTCAEDETVEPGSGDGYLEEAEFDSTTDTLKLTMSDNSEKEADLSDLRGTGGSLWSEKENNVYRSDGYVGIGTTTPAANLDIVSTVQTPVKIKSNNETGTNLLLSNTDFEETLTMGIGADNMYLWSKDDKDMIFGTYNTKAIRITKNSEDLLIKIPSLSNCDTIDTEEDGTLKCGHDSTGGGGDGVLDVVSFADTTLTFERTADLGDLTVDLAGLDWGCEDGQVIKWDTSTTPDSWVCADDDTGTETVPTTCADGQILMWNATDTKWQCVFVEEAIKGCEENYGQVLMWLQDVDDETEDDQPGWGCGDVSSVLEIVTDVSESEICPGGTVKMPKLNNEGTPQTDSEGNPLFVCQSPASTGYWDGYDTGGNLHKKTGNPYAYILNNGSTLRPVGIGGNFTGTLGTDPVGALLHVKNDNTDGTMYPGLAIIGGQIFDNEGNSWVESQVGDGENLNGGINNVIIGHGTVINSSNNDHDYQIAIGNLNTNNGDRSMSFGNSITTGGEYQIGIGRDVDTGTGDNNFAFGNNIEIERFVENEDPVQGNSNSFAIGNTLKIDNANKEKSFALGSHAQSSGEGSMAIGLGANFQNGEAVISADYPTAAFGNHSLAIGRSAEAYGENAIAIGLGAVTGEHTGGSITGDNSLAIGNGVKVSVNNAFAIGRNAAVNDQKNSILISNSGGKDIFIDTNGNTGFGTDEPSLAKVDINGKLRVQDRTKRAGVTEENFICTDDEGVLYESATPCDQGGLYVCHLKKQTCYTECESSGCPTIGEIDIITVSGETGTTCGPQSALTDVYISDTNFVSQTNVQQIDIDEDGTLDIFVDSTGRYTCLPMN